MQTKALTEQEIGEYAFLAYALLMRLFALSTPEGDEFRKRGVPMVNLQNEVEKALQRSFTSDDWTKVMQRVPCEVYRGKITLPGGLTPCQTFVFNDASFEIVWQGKSITGDAPLVIVVYPCHTE